MPTLAERETARQDSDAPFSVKGETTAKILWQAKKATGDYHDAMTDKMFMDWIEYRLKLAFEAKYEGRQVTLIVDNASYHHGDDPEVRVPESNTKSATLICCAS